MDRLARIKMLFGDEAIKKLQSSSVMIVGCGAVGSFAIEALARCGVNHLILIDFDKIEESNINRQLFALSSTIGTPKVDVAAARICDINPAAHVDALNIFFDAETKLDAHPDFVIDAIDSVPSKIALYKWCTAQQIPFAASMGAARKTDIGQIKISSISRTTVCPLAAKIRRLSRESGLPDFPVVYSTEIPTGQLSANRTFGSIVTVTGTFGLMLANYAIDNIIAK